MLFVACGLAVDGARGGYQEDSGGGTRGPAARFLCLLVLSHALGHAYAFFHPLSPFLAKKVKNARWEAVDLTCIKL